MEEQVERILELLKEGNVSTIVLSGRSGSGKSWMARKVGLLAVREKVVDLTLWICLSARLDERALYEHIAHQLSILSTSMEMENDDNEIMEDKVSEEETLEVLKEKVRVRLSGDGVCRGILLVLDDEGNKMNEEDGNLEKFLQFIKQVAYKPSTTVADGDGQQKFRVLITSVNEGVRHQTEGRKVVIDMLPLTPELAISLLQKKAGAKVFEVPGILMLVEDFINRKAGLTPREVALLAQLLNYHQQDSRVQDLEHALEEASHFDTSWYSELLSYGYDKVPDGVLVDFSWQGNHFFRERGCIHYSELISYWIMEGYLGPICSLEKAYDEGHRILMQLMDYQMLKRVNDEFLCMEKTMLNLNDYHRRGFGGTANLGMANVLFDSYSWDGIGKVTKMDGMIRTLGSCRKGQQLTTLLIDGNCLRREDSNYFLQSNQELQILGLFGLVLLPHSLFCLRKLNVLVLRDCDFLESIDDVKELRMLTILEVSGSCLIKSIPDNFFTQLTQLRSLHFSDLQIEVLPKSFYDLTELRWLILKDCSHLTRLQSLRKCEKLMVVDLSGAASLINFPEKNLKSLPKLKTLNLSRTKIKSLPILHETGELTHLSVSGCRNMHRMPSIRTLTNLQVLDLSWSTIKEFHDKSLQSNSSLKILDLSGTTIPSELLPSNISKPREFYLRCCSEIKYINCTASSKDLEMLDFSGACNLVKIEGKFFECLGNLRVLNLSETKIKDLPNLSALRNLRQLLLSCCVNLEKLPSLTSSKLEELDLSDCKALTMIEDISFKHLPHLKRLVLSKTKIERLPELNSLSNLEELNLNGVTSFKKADFLEHMSKLQVLVLSETLLEQLPTLSNLKNLNHLSLRACGLLETLPPLDELQNIEILDLSGTAIRNLPSLENLNNLRILLLECCSNLEDFENIKAQDFSAVQTLPCGISMLTQLQHLALPGMKHIQAADCNKMISLQQKISGFQWSISSVDRVSPNINRFLMCHSSSLFLELLQSNHSLWKTTSNHFHLCVCPIDLQNEAQGLLFHKDELIFRDIYLLSRHFPNSDAQGRLLEIHRLHIFPRGAENVLGCAEYIFLFDNSFIKSLADLSACNVKMMKGCWVEGCQSMEFVIQENDVVDTIELGTALEFLWISNTMSLRSIYSEKLQSGGYQNLKCLYLDCCPKLSSVFFSSNMLQKLEILHVKFCENLETLFGHDLEEHNLPNLQILRLWELPELKAIGCLMPSLQRLEVGECPMLGQVLSSSHVPETLEVLKVRNCLKLNNLLEGLISGNCKLPRLRELQLSGLPKLTRIGIEPPLLQTLEVGDCPLLLHVISSTHVPQKLAVLKVRFCANLDTLFVGVPSENCILPSLNTVQLWGLPKLKSVGVMLPTLPDIIIRECPKLTVPML